jgi:hypothetical protein
MTDEEKRKLKDERLRAKLRDLSDKIDELESLPKPKHDERKQREELAVERSKVVQDMLDNEHGLGNLDDPEQEKAPCPKGASGP